MTPIEPNVQVWNQDCIAGMSERLAAGSVHLVVTSIPFEELFTYSGKLEDVGNNGSTVDIRAGRFAANMRFVVHQLFRVLAPGCNACIHIQQLLAYKVQHGYMGRRDFRGAMIDVFGAGGFNFIGECAIQKNPQAMAQRMSLHSLMFISGKRNAAQLAPCPNDYVLIFQKPGEIEHPVRALYDAEVNPEGWLTTDEWIRDAHGIWTDIQETDVLDGWKAARETDEEKHVCPLQLSVIMRMVKLYTNPICYQPDVTVLDPFMGIGSTACVCIGAESTSDGKIERTHFRNVVGFELKESYFDQCWRNIAKYRAAAKRTEEDEYPLLKGLA